MDTEISMHAQCVYFLSSFPLCLYFLAKEEYENTGCPTIEFSLCFAFFLGLPYSYRGSFYHFSTAQETTIPKTHLTFLLTSKIDQVTAQNVRQTVF